ALFAQYPVLAPKPRQFFPLTAGQSVAALSRIELRLSDPLPNALDRRFELPRQLLQRPPRSRQFDHPPPILSRVWCMGFWHCFPPCLSSPNTLHETGSTPVLRLMEVFRRDDVLAGVRAAIARGVIGFDAVKHLVLCRIECRPPRLDLKIYPYLPRATVATTLAKTYLSLLAGAAS